MFIAPSRRMFLFALVALSAVPFAPVRPASAQETAWAAKMFEANRCDFGDVARGAEVVRRIKITNLYKETAHISNVRTSCGCTTAKATKTTLASLEEGFLELNLDTVKHTGKKDVKVTITFDQPFPADVVIAVTAYIRTDVVLEPGGANFGSIELGAAPTRKINITYAGRPDWRIVNVRSDSSDFTTNVVETGRGGGRVNYELAVSLKPNLPLGEFRGQLFLQTDDAGAAQIPVIVEARVEADITVTPELVSLGTLQPGKSNTVNVVVRGKKPFAIEKLECESDLNAFKVRLPKDQRAVHVIPLTVTPPEKPGKFTETFTLTIEGRPQPVMFKAYGTILEAKATN